MAWGMDNRRAGRYRLKVIHEHAAAGRTERRVSELIFVGGEPRIILGWVDLGGVRAPVYVPRVDARRLHALGVKDFYRYDGVTRDPQDTATLPALPGTSERTTPAR